MTVTEWAENEARLACKRENPNYDFDSEEFDYGCSCYKSALKAYKSLLGDGHSGFSFSMTAKILKRLMDGLPLTEITDADFDGAEPSKTINGVVTKQCPRMFSLFRDEYPDGRVEYHDIDGSYLVDAEFPSNTYSGGWKFVNEVAPITMPYYPVKGKYAIYQQMFLSDPKNGDFDTKGMLYMVTPEGERVDINRYYTEKNGGFEEISKDEYLELLAKRVDKVPEKTAAEIVWTLVSNTGSSEAFKLRREAIYDSLDKEWKDKFMLGLSKLCEIFDNPENWKYNTYSTYHRIADGKPSADWPEGILRIYEYIQELKGKLNYEGNIETLV